MNIFPAIDIVGDRAVRLRQGDYSKVTVYGNEPEKIADDFISKGAKCIHIVDLEGAKTGDMTNFAAISRVLSKGLFSEVGGGIRSPEAVERYLEAGASRVILGTAAIQNQQFLKDCIGKYGEKIAVGADVKDGKIAVKGWLESTDIGLMEFGKNMQDIGVRTLICTDISRDGEMRGSNIALYRRLTAELRLEIVASGGVSSLDEIRELKACGCSGAILGKAYYEGLVSLESAIQAAL